jgi:UDP-glucuronate decarboxylase
LLLLTFGVFVRAARDPLIDRDFAGADAPKERRVTTNLKSNGSKRPQAQKQKSPTRAMMVCGGAGFLGSHLCSRLLRAGHRVICVDNFCTSDPEAVQPLLRHPHFELMRADIAVDVAKLAEAGEVEAIFNLACAASPVHYQRKPLDTLFTSVRGMDNLLKLARRCGARVFQASTSEIYGHPTMHPQTEKYWGHVNTVGPRACYDEGKRCAETLCFIYSQEYGVTVRIGRIFNTYGPGMHVRDGRVVVNFIVQALAGEPLTVYGDGRQTRSFCYVDDLIDAIVRMMDPSNECAGPINLGNPAEIEVLDLAHRVIRLTGSSSRIEMCSLPTDDPPRRRPDIALAQRVLGWRPTTDLDTGLALTIRDMEARLSRGETELLDAADQPRAVRSAVVGVNAL